MDMDLLSTDEQCSDVMLINKLLYSIDSTDVYVSCLCAYASVHRINSKDCVSI